MAQLSDLLVRVEVVAGSPAREVLVHGVVMDSRQVQPGSLFVAIGGGSQDGHSYIPDAVRRSAAVIVGERPVEDLEQSLQGVPYIQVANGRVAVSRLSAAFFGFPAHQMTVIGVTGTDGKTTTATLIHQILHSAGLNAGLISTVHAVIGDQRLDTGFHVTTPDAPAIQAYLAQMVSSGVTHVVIETTSHGLDQYRVHDCEFDLAVLTNLTHEHLDYHGTFAAYRSAKGRLFEYLAAGSRKPFAPRRAAVLNRDDESYGFFAEICKPPALSYGLHIDADVRADAVAYKPKGLSFVAVGRDLQGSHFQFPVAGRLFGGFNLANYLAAIALTQGVMQIDAGHVSEGISKVSSIPGRMEIVDMGQDFTALVDFAHTPNSLQKALSTCRRQAAGKVIAVTGSAGLRDREKRSMMGAIAGRYADLVLITAEDPRTESLAQILESVAAGARSAGSIQGESYWVVPDRRAAIRQAVGAAAPGDIVLVCGKGHEQTMCFGEVEFPWDDRTALRAALSELLGQPGPEMPFLPELAD